jgi:putative transposase
VASGLDEKRLEDIRAATNGNFALGDRRFGLQISAMLGRRAERGAPGKPKTASKKDPKQIALPVVPEENMVCP